MRQGLRSGYPTESGFRSRALIECEGYTYYIGVELRRHNQAALLPTQFADHLLARTLGVAPRGIKLYVRTVSVEA